MGLISRVSSRTYRNFRTKKKQIMSAIKVPTSQREEFKKYLELSGIQEKMVNMLVNLYEEPEKPADPFAYFKSLLEAEDAESADIEALKQENASMKVKITEAEAKIEELTAKVKEMSPAEDETAE